MPVGVTGHRTQRPRGQVGPPGPHPAQPSSSLDPGGERWPIFRPLAPLIAQLVLGLRISSYLVHSVVCTPISSLRKAKTCFAPPPALSLIHISEPTRPY